MGMSLSVAIPGLLRLVPPLFVIVGVIFAWLGSSIAFDATEFADRSIATQVTVIEVEQKDGQNGIVYRPRFAVDLPNGQRLTYAGTVWLSPQPHVLGEVVPGRYDPDSGEIISDHMIAGTKWFGRIFISLGSFLSLLGVALFVWRRWSQSHSLRIDRSWSWRSNDDDRDPPPPPEA
jgi:hypothetical protein